MASTAASTPRSSGTDAGTLPVTSSRPWRATSVAAGSRPMNDHRLHRSPCSTDSKRNPGWSPTHRAKADTGVTRSASTSRHTGTTVWSVQSLRNSSLLGRSIGGAKRPVEAGEVAGVAGAVPLLLDHEQQHVAIAV